jgi:hypothetical protein
MQSPQDVYAAEREMKTSRIINQIMAMIVIIAVPAFLVLCGVRAIPGKFYENGNPTPYGYTISLLLFLSPVTTMGYQLLKTAHQGVHRRAFIWAVCSITLIGFTLDIIFGASFFTFKNTGATLGILLPAWSFEKMSWIPNYLPIEEFAFYILGSLFMLTMYLWIERSWLEDEQGMDRQNSASRVKKLVQVNPRTLVFWIGCIVAGVAYKKFIDPVPGFPGYYLFIMVIGFLPTVLFMKGIQNFVNWRAFAMAYGVLMFVELMWEVTLALPFDWWNYQAPRMIGIRANPWHELPIEAALLWVVVAWDCIIAFELFRVYFHMDDVPVKHVLFGNGKGTALKPAAIQEG